MTLRLHDDWSARGFDRPALADRIGPFAGRDVLQTWWECCGAGEVVFAEDDHNFLPLQRLGSTVRSLGHEDLFDYHSPLGGDPSQLVAALATTLEPGLTIDLNSLPAEAARPVLDGLSSAGLRPTTTVHESAAVLDVADGYDEYLAALGKKQRHETRRKTRRFIEAIGEPRLEEAKGIDAIARFAAMHRLSGGRKGQFMDETMEGFFVSLQENAGARVDFLYGDGAEPVAAAFGWWGDDGYYLYNSAYDPEASAASPGIVLVSELIRRTAEAGTPRFDFLKGDEVYKYRLGAIARPLWRIQATTGELRR